jgi:NADH dehydrogenase FAD-containing subunit
VCSSDLVLLAEGDKAVSLISHSGLGGRKGPDDMITFRGLLRKLVKLGVPLYLKAEVMEIVENSLVIGWEEETFSVPAETIVAAVGVKSDDKLSKDLRGIVPEIYQIGDCMMPGNAAQAVFSATKLALKL